MPLDMGDVAIVPLEPRNGHMAIIARCIYNALQNQACLLFKYQSAEVFGNMVSIALLHTSRLPT